MPQSWEIFKRIMARIPVCAKKTLHRFINYIKNTIFISRVPYCKKLSPLVSSTSADLSYSPFEQVDMQTLNRLTFTVKLISAKGISDFATSLLSVAVI